MKRILLLIIPLIFLVGYGNAPIEKKTSKHANKVLEEEAIQEKVDAGDKVFIFSLDKTEDEYIQSLYDIHIENDDDLDRNYIMVFKEHEILVGEDSGEFFSSVFWDKIEIDHQEKTILMHIFQTLDIEYLSDGSTETTPIPLDYHIKLSFEGDSLKYYNDYGTDNVYLSNWKISKKDA